MKVKLTSDVEYHSMKGFAVAENRLVKAKKIEAVLAEHLHRPVKGFKILDVGTGAGAISSYFARLGNNVHSVDVADQRKFRDFTFKQVEGEQIPYNDSTFDIVISNFVLEHVKNRDSHLKEVARVMKPGGIGYISSPNWFFPFDPHYGIPLIHYLPRRAYFGLLKLLGKYKEDVNLPSYWQLRRNLSKYFIWGDKTPQLNKHPGKYFVDVKICYRLCKLPFWFLRLMNWLSMSHIYIVRKKSNI